MNEQSMLNQLAENAGLSFLELKGFYDTVKEKGQADEEDMQWLCNLDLPVEFTFHIMQLPPPIGATVPFDVLQIVFERMLDAKRIDTEQSYDDLRHFVISYMVNHKKSGLGFGEADVSMKDKSYPNKMVILSQLSKDENVHPSNICIITMRELSGKDFADYMKSMF